ncbi:unnamed protein product [Acanthoscelides obtectus]|uniref:MSL3 chromodomain-like domain-containing protein n=1 Tax=Acanthoscelides obtectus TaxID=200917 RepID=A0A9P0L645_ACAOB|nr:unnamed protein product [Acanthoscelides obtectus]CAK1635175.1 Protein male-specific lethal-3 [Acanthoscelides obtectus]
MGWNSSWDRCVDEEFVLKDTPENRQLQKDLAEKSQLQLGAYLYRRERKKSQKNSERASASEDGSSDSPTRMDTDDGHGMTTSSEEDSSIEDEIIHIEITPDLREILEYDYYAIKEKNKVNLHYNLNISICELIMYNKVKISAWNKYALLVL